MFNKVSKSALSTIVVSSDPLSPIPSTSTAMETPENIEEEPDDPEPADGEGIPMGCDWLYSSSIRAVTKNYL